MAEHFLEDETYRQLVDDLMAIAGRVDRQEIIDALAVANVWPLSCFLDSANHQKGTTSALTLVRPNYVALGENGAQ